MKPAAYTSLIPLVAGSAISRSSSGALYLLENDPIGANIVSVRVDSAGFLSDPVRTSTGAKGPSA